MSLRVYLRLTEGLSHPFYRIIMIRPISISDLMVLHSSIPLVDVRTPAEYNQGHIPAAFNIPLFSNEERVIVGTTYKQTGREAAILLGFDLTGPKWSGFIRQALEIAPQKKIVVHCWRGGMRSGAMAWALDLYGFEVYVIQGGYKQFRQWVFMQFASPYSLRVLGGMTGTGKTRILHELRSLGEPIIDLEKLAQHQGSAYGSLNKLIQPTQEQFENNLAVELHLLPPSKPIWVEDESITIGKRVIPRPFWDQIITAPLVHLEVASEQRIAFLVEEYGKLDTDFLIACTERIHKRQGPRQTRDAIAAIREGRMEAFIQLVLTYYDKTYRAGLARRDHQLQRADVTITHYTQCAQQVLQAAQQFQHPLS